MENASKALLMAANILIAILIIAILTNTFSDITFFQNTKANEEEKEKIIEFNEQYTKYLNQYVYGTEVLSLMNKYENDKKVQVILEGGSEQPSKEENKNKETKFYKCIQISYNNSTGKVKSITFKQIKISSNVQI